MGNSIATLALAAAVLTAPAALAQTVAPTGAVACISVGGVFRYADAVDRQDAADQHKLLQGECRIVEGKPYALLEDHNGAAKILVFRKPNDWETAETLYALDEMLQFE